MYCDDVLTNAIAAKNRQLEEENARLKELNREMVGLLMEMDIVEAIEENGDMFSFCPICGSYNNGHKKHCRLQKVLAKAEGEA